MCKVCTSLPATTLACLALALGLIAEVCVDRTLMVTILPPLEIIFMCVTSRTFYDVITVSNGLMDQKNAISIDVFV